MASISMAQAQAGRLATAALSGDISALHACLQLHDLLPELGLATDDEARLAIIAVVSMSDHIPRDGLGPIDDLPSYDVFNRKHGALERDARRLMSAAFPMLAQCYHDHATSTREDRADGHSSGSQNLAGLSAQSAVMMRATQQDDED